jgi:hypothetical protein
MSAGEAFPLTRPTKPDSWLVIARSKKVAADWIELSNQVSGECQRVFDQLSADPKYDDGDRQQRLEGEAGKGTYESRKYQRWQIDVGSGSQVWYFIDDTKNGSGQKRRSGTVIIDQVHAGHPKSTKQSKSGKRRPGRK